MPQRGHFGIELSEFEVASTAVPQEVALSVKYIAAYLEETAEDIHALARLLASCSNLCYLRVHGYNIPGLSGAISCPFPRMHTLCFAADGVYPAADIATLLQLMPNLHTIMDFPEIEGELPHLPTEPLKLQHLSIIPWRVGSPALPLLLSRRWTTRSLHLWVSSGTWDWLAAVDWLGVQPLLEIEDAHVLLSVPTRGGPAPALAFITACPNLQRLALYASPAELVDMLPAIFSTCRRLGRLELDVRDDAPQETAHDLETVARILCETPPPGLRALKVERMERVRSPGLERLREMCLARRVSYIIKEGQ